MSRNEKVYRSSNNQRPKTPLEKNKSNKIITPHVVEEEEDCSICLEPLDSFDEESNTKKIIKQLKCGHKFHEKCINAAINSRRNLIPGPRCPMCRTPIIEEGEIPESQRRLQEVIDYENNLNSSVPFIGILVCLNNQILIKYLNTDFNLGTNNTLNQLKTAILSRSDEISRQRGIFCPVNLGVRANNLVASATRLVQRRVPSFKIKRIGFGVPLSCNFDFIQINYNEPALGLTPLRNLYSSYQYYAEDVLRNPHEYELFNNYIEDVDVSTNLQSVYNRTQYSDTPCFLNSQNPDIPEDFRPNNIPIKATINSLAWLIVHIKCTTFSGGKTIKRKSIKRKSIKRKSIKRKSIKRKSIK